MKQTLTIILFTLSSIMCYAQSVMLTPTESTCQNNGQIEATLSGFGNAPYQYLIANADMSYSETLTSNNTTETFTTLEPGDYTVTVTDNDNSSSSSTITVAGDWQLQTITNEVTDPIICAGDDGTISSTINFGEGPFQVDIYEGADVDPSTATPLQTNSNITQGSTVDFAGLAPGSYTIVAIDNACNDNQVTETYTISQNNESVNIQIVDYTIVNCTTINYTITASSTQGGELEYRIASPPEYETSWQTSPDFSATGSPSFAEIPELTFEVRSADCPNVTATLSRLITPTISNPQVVNTDCDGWDFEISAIGFFEPEWFWTDPETGDMHTSTTMPTVENIPYGTEICIRIREQNGCHDTEAEGCKTVDAFGKLSPSIYPNNCNLGETVVNLSQDVKATNNVTVELTQYPAAYTDNTIRTNYSAPQIIKLAKVFYNPEFVPGDYTVQVTDACNRVVDTTFTLTEDDFLQLSLGLEETPNCSNSSITATLTTNKVYPLHGFTLYRASDDSVVEGPIKESWPTASDTQEQVTFDNVVPGDYYVIYKRCSNGSELREDITITGISTPTILATTGVTCGDGNVSIFVEGQGGKLNYEYRILSGGALTAPTDWQTDPYLGNYPAIQSGEDNYIIQLKDACAEIVSQEVTTYQSITPTIDIIGTDCDNGVVTFTVSNPIRGAEYTWTLPDNTTATGTEAVYSGTPGNVQLQSIFPTNCAQDDLTTTWDGSCEQLLPVKWISFRANIEKIKAVLRWSTASESNSKYFNVLKTTDGRKWESIGTVEAYGNSTETVNYEFIDDELKAGVSYYKLEQFDFDGKSSFSKTVSVSYVSDHKWSLVPNPTSGLTYMQFPDNMNEDIQVAIFNLQGKVLRQYSIAAGSQSFPIATDQLNSGVYLVKVISNSATIHIQKLVVTK